MKIPIKFGPDVYCRAESKLLLAYDDQQLYIGYTPAGADPGRNCAAQISALNGETAVPYTCSMQDNKIVLRAGTGYLEFAISDPDKLIVSGQGLGIVISNGKAKNMFMGGGNAVIDARGGGLFAIAGVKLRFLARAGCVKPESRWDFNYLCDPDPKLYLLPDESGKLELAVFASENEENVADDGISVDQAAEKLAREFFEFCDLLSVDRRQTAAVRAAWTLWNCRQPQRRAYELDLKLEPVYIRGRQSSGSLFAEDYALYSLISCEPDEGLRLLLAPFDAIQQDGFMPSILSNHKLIFTCTPPLFGIVLECRGDIAALVGLKEYDLFQKAFGWWREKRYCDQHNLFYYLHRTENGRKEPVPYISFAPIMAPDLNTYMLLWIRQMKKLAERLHISDDAAEWHHLHSLVSDGIERYLRTPDGFRCVDVSGGTAQGGYSGAVLPYLLKEENVFQDKVLPAVQMGDYAAEFLAMRGCTEPGKKLAKSVLEQADGKSIPDIRSAVSCLLASRVLSEGR